MLDEKTVSQDWYPDPNLTNIHLASMEVNVSCGLTIFQMMVVQLCAFLRHLLSIIDKSMMLMDQSDDPLINYVMTVLWGVYTFLHMYIFWNIPGYGTRWQMEVHVSCLDI